MPPIMYLQVGVIAQHLPADGSVLGGIDIHYFYEEANNVNKGGSEK